MFPSKLLRIFKKYDTLSFIDRKVHNIEEKGGLAKILKKSFSCRDNSI